MKVKQKNTFEKTKNDVLKGPKKPAMKKMKRAPILTTTPAKGKIKIKKTTLTSKVSKIFSYRITTGAPNYRWKLILSNNLWPPDNTDLYHTNYLLSTYYCNDSYS